MDEELPHQFGPSVHPLERPPLHRSTPRADGVPRIRRAARTALAVADQLWWRLHRQLVNERPSLVAVGLHSLCPDRSQVDDPVLAPNQNVSVGDFRNLVDALLEDGYSAVSPAQVAAGLDPHGKFVMITFDDGYYNNVLALDVLKQYRVPATFLVSSNHVLEGKAFWWDALNRVMVKAGATEHQRNAEIARTKVLAVKDVEADLRQRYGAGCLLPAGDADRPFTAAELADFARQPWVHLGNHTCDHEILTRCPAQEMRRQIEGCQRALIEITGTAPVAIAYPNGNWSPEVIAAARAAGLQVGLTVHPRHNLLPLACPQRLMNLGRFYFYGDSDPRRELLKMRAGAMPSHLVKQLLQGMR